MNAWRKRPSILGKTAAEGSGAGSSASCHMLVRAPAAA